ncbi:hypothetical protein Glove_230g66 [Diversispora epigaea]|uniref:Uncharacterized protein n=1 Tax=Diversispora epigaea TaxID=1348612 RepID=A0A397ID38_9GLOM|nr:hypothetical protein Glove_230g66 [Diversispora epigaea]
MDIDIFYYELEFEELSGKLENHCIESKASWLRYPNDFTVRLESGKSLFRQVKISPFLGCTGLWFLNEQKVNALEHF